MAYRWKAKSTTPGDWVFLNAALTAAMGWPAQADVKLNVHYGYSPEQFTGSLVVTGGGAGTYPHEADTWIGTGLYGPTGSEYTPAMRASDIANCEAGYIKDGVAIDDVTGTYGHVDAGGSGTTYDTIEDGIKAALMMPGTLFKDVKTFGSQLSDSELADELKKLVSQAPAAIVVYEGGDTNSGYAGSLEEAAMYAVICVAASTSREGALRGTGGGHGVYELLDQVRDRLHNRRGISGIPVPLQWQGNQRLSLPNMTMTVAAYAARFKAPLGYIDGDG
jgi:phage gp37-like protein